MQFDLTTLRKQPNVTVSVTVDDLREFARVLLNEFSAEQKERVEQEKHDQITLSTAQVRERLGVKNTTLWRWAKIGYLKPLKVGMRNLYRLGDVERIESGKGGRK